MRRSCIRERGMIGYGMNVQRKAERTAGGAGPLSSRGPMIGPCWEQFLLGLPFSDNAQGITIITGLYASN